MRAAALAACALLLLAGCSSPRKELPPEWQGRDVEAGGWAHKTIQANWSFGLEYALPKDRKVSWDWVAVTSGALYFQLLLVVNGQAIPIVGTHGNAHEGSYTTRQAGTYVLAWELDGLPDTLLHHKSPEGAIPYDWPPGQGPGCPPSRLLLC